jgi:hypothetical protein
MYKYIFQFLTLKVSNFQKPDGSREVHFIAQWCLRYPFEQLEIESIL